MADADSQHLTGFEESIGFYYELGLAITQWAHVEQSLFWIVSTCFPKRSGGKVALGFFAIENFRSKLQFADRVFKATHQKKKFAVRWNNLHSELVRLSKVRNNLAHYHVMSYPNATPGRRYALLPRYIKPGQFKQSTPKPPSEAICIKEVVHARYQFFSLANAVEFLAYDLIGYKTQLPASFAQAKAAPTTLKLTREIRAILRPPVSPLKT